MIDNDALGSIGALGGLARVGGEDGPHPDLEIAGNERLASLAGLEAVAEIGGSLRIDDNAALADVSSLFGVTEVRGDVEIRWNAALPDGAAEALVAEIDAIGGAILLEGP